MTTTRTEWSIKVTELNGDSYVVYPIMGGPLDLTMMRLRDLQDGESPQTYTLVKREITIGEWQEEHE
jgi:hypothetical protein